MENAHFSFFVSSSLSLVVTTSLAIIKYYQRQRVEFRHLAEFYASLLFLVLMAHRFGTKTTPLIVLSVIPWVWILRTLSLLFGDICGVTVMRKGHYQALGIGVILSVAMVSIGYELPFVLIPYAFSVALIGISFLADAFQKGPRQYYGPIHYWNFAVILGFLVSRLAFMTGDGPSFDYGFGVLFAVSLFPLYSEVIFERKEKFLESALFIRNKQLFSHSSFSEFKILSAGITHEINNALTVINAKIEQMIRRSSGDQEKNLRVILHSADRIGKSVRGLREFIYPNDQLEELEIEVMVKNVLMLYGQRLRNHGVTVTTHGLGGKYVRGHRLQLEQVFLSFLSNSVDSLDVLDEKWIDISARSEGHEVIFTFKDSSHGIGRDIENMMNDPFFCTEDNVDNGLRLILAKEIIQKHSGTLHYDRSSSNTTFVIKLPLVETIHYAEEYTREHPLQ